MNKQRSFRRPSGLTLLTWGLLLVLGVLSVYPTVTMLAGAFRDGSPFFGKSGWSLEGFARAFGSAQSQQAILNSVILALVTAIVGTGLGFVFAWVATRTTVPLRRLVTPIMVITVALPSLFNAMSWAVLANDQAGIFNQLWRALSGADTALLNIYGWTGLILLSLIKPIAISYLLLLGPTASLSRGVEEAAVLAGTNPVVAMFRVVGPVLTPTILAVFIINLIIGLESFDIPALIAIPAGIPLLSTEVYNYVHESIPADYPAASALAMAICLLVMLLVWIRWRLVAKHSYATVTGKSGGQGLWELRGWAPVFTALIVVFTLLALLLPFVQLVVGSFQPLFGNFSRFSFSNYAAVLGNSEIIGAIFRSLAVGVGGGLLAMLFTFAVAYVVRHAGGRASSRVLDLATWLPAALPGVVLGLALSWAYLSLPFLRPLYGGPVMLTLALMIAGMPLAARASEGGVLAIHRELEEAAAVSGATRARTVANVLVPLIAPSFLAGWLITSLYVAGRLDVPVLLSTSGNKLAIVSVYELYSNGRSGEAAAVFCLLLLGFAVIASVLALLAFSIQRLVLHTRKAILLGDARPTVTATESLVVAGSNDVHERDSNQQSVGAHAPGKVKSRGCRSH